MLEMLFIQVVTNESLLKVILVRTRNLPLIANDCESPSALEIEDRQRAADGTPHSLWAAPDYLCGEASQPAPGERRRGTGCDACDQETRAWNPSFMSMSYALSRLNRVETVR
jgi:hypothetical protein